jgi:hypothetical protein
VFKVATDEWYEVNPARWRAEQEIAHYFMEGVEVGLDDHRWAFLVGTFSLVSQHGHIYDTFQIKILYPTGFPERRCPEVYLLSHHSKWRNEGDSHIEHDWKLCLYVPGESGIDFRKRDSLLELFCCLHTFLFKERIYQRDLVRSFLSGKPAVWPGEARSHGLQGLREAIRDRGKIGRNEYCPCGSGKKFKHCCMAKIEG